MAEQHYGEYNLFHTYPSPIESREFVTDVRRIRRKAYRLRRQARRNRIANGRNHGAIEPSGHTQAHMDRLRISSVLRSYAHRLSYMRNVFLLFEDIIGQSDAVVEQMLLDNPVQDPPSMDLEINSIDSDFDPDLVSIDDVADSVGNSESESESDHEFVFPVPFAFESESESES